MQDKPTHPFYCRPLQSREIQANEGASIALNLLYCPAWAKHRITLGCHKSSASDTASSGEEDRHYDRFDFTLIQPFLKEVRQALLWEDVVEESQTKQRKHFRNVKNEGLNFTFMEGNQKIIAKEWRQVDRGKTVLQSCIPLDTRT